MPRVDKNYLIVEILRMIPSSLPYLMKKGLCGLGCIETDSGSLETVAKRKGFSDQEIEDIIEEINRLSKIPT
ncbi:MAG: DUF1858 domain-containing protein [Ignavibacteria bacterium]|jgi:hypothetical protein|nr:DUF1858 domain-containing protein [Ignavibacteria bacterium]MCU7504677.1 DUF1858 domain-containing protein [Ignavibacteria bacterium]MCU7517515.1 DUF1858 domain-containing protein [Ignavibacteria bacterium]